MTSSQREAAATALFRTSALLDPIRLHIWDREGLTVTQLRLLGFLYEQEGRSNAELAELLYVTRPSVSALLERLERGGYIRREVSPEDRRGIRIWLEERGRQTFTSLRGELREYAIGLLDHLDDKEVEEVTAALNKLIASGRAKRHEALKQAEAENATADR
jgi:DNA-binding MarR family transcriptional regulator